MRCYRGVARSNLHYPDALQGVARPRGGPASPEDHCLGDTASKYTSWTTNRTVAEQKALDADLGSRGVILVKDFDADMLTSSPDYFGESEVLVTGTVTGASVEWVP